MHRSLSLFPGSRPPHWLCLPIVIVSLQIAASLSPVIARPITVRERIDAQRAIEHVYWRHRVWPDANPGERLPFESVFGEPVLRGRVEDYLRKESFLASRWERPIRGEDLQRELGRLVAHSRDPGTLRELFAALENDPILIAECLVLPILADRMIRDGYGRDVDLHADLRREARRQIAQWRTGRGGPRGTTSRIVEYRRDAQGNASDPTPASGGGSRVVLDEDDWRRLIFETGGARDIEARGGGIPTEDPMQGASPVDRFGSMTEDGEGLFARRVAGRSAESIHVETVSWDKRPFDAWWEEERRHVEVPWDDGTQRTGARYTIELPLTAACEQDTWRPMQQSIPQPRSGQVSIWTGSELIIWGGAEFVSLGTGGRYDPATDTWTAISRQGAPSQRVEHAAVWTGREMIVWGGYNSTTDAYLQDGARYDPAADSWTPVGASGQRPSGRTLRGSGGVWTGREMIVWGGYDGAAWLSTGGRYDPVADTWTATRNDATTPSRRHTHTSVWTGTEMIVWGGWDGTNYLATGGRYDPVSDTWAPTRFDATTPRARWAHSVVWTGTMMVIWGGRGTSIDQSGGRYDPATNTWTPTRVDANTPAARRHGSSVWTGSEMIVWGGWAGATGSLAYINTGGRYNPSTDTWVPTRSDATAPGPRGNHTAIWTGSEMIIWAGITAIDGFHTFFNDGRRYDPGTDSWIPMAPDAVPPLTRADGAAVWTGSEMVVWGGIHRNAAILASGAKYVPATDTWSPTSALGAPAKRYHHSAVWTGTEMIVWGGLNSVFTAAQTGGCYDPALDSWRATAINPPTPSARFRHTAVWTGSEMIVWGGQVPSTFSATNTGGRYDPGTDTWRIMDSGPAAPAPRVAHSAHWTGKEMFVWGGQGVPGYVSMNTGGRYDPTTDGWTPIDASGAPDPRAYHASVWTGSSMLVWGGVDTAELGDGGRYDVVADAWSPISGAGAPSARSLQVSVWTGSEMPVWGGRWGLNNDLHDGGLYCACGGAAATYYRDADGDGQGVPADTIVTACGPPIGFVENALDCDDGDPGVWSAPGPARDLAFAADRSSISWQPPAMSGGVSVAYDTMRTSDPADFGSAAICVEWDDPTDTAARDPEEPSPSGTIFYYIIAAKNACGRNLGVDGVGVPRVGSDCP